MICSAGRCALGALVLLACAACNGTPRPATPGAAAPLLRIVASDSAFALPARVPAGYTEVRLVNAGTVMHEGVLCHYLTPTATALQYIDSVRAGIDLPAFEEDIGGPGLAAPGDSTTVWLDFTPGHYGVQCWYASHMSKGQARDFEVVASGATATPPTVDLGVRMYDFSYGFDGDWTAGKHRVLVENFGSEPHEFDPYRLESGKTPADFTTWLEHGRHGMPPAKALGGSGSFVPGRKVWMPITLAPGRYFAFCEVPAQIGHKPHYMLGMLHEFEVK